MSHDIPADAPGGRHQLVVPPSEQDHWQGSLGARVVLVEYGDYQCPQCGELYALIKTVQERLNATFFEENHLVDFGGSLPAIMQPKPYPCKST